MLDSAKRTVRDIVSQASEPYIEKLDEDTELLISGLLDSLAVIRIATAIEECLQLEVPPMDISIENFQSLNAIYAYMDSRVQS